MVYVISQCGLGSALVDISLASTRFISLSLSAHLKSAGEVGCCCRARVLENLKPSVKHSHLEMNFCSTHCPELVTLANRTQGGHAVQSYHMAGRAGNYNCSTNLALYNTSGTLQ